MGKHRAPDEEELTGIVVEKDDEGRVVTMEGDL